MDGSVKRKMFCDVQHGHSDVNDAELLDEAATMIFQTSIKVLCTKALV